MISSNFSSSSVVSSSSSSSNFTSMNSSNSLSESASLIFSEVDKKGLESSSNASNSSSVTSSITSTLKQVSSLEFGYFIALSIKKVILSSPTPRLSSRPFTLIMASAVFKKGLPKIKGTRLSSSISKITKSTGKTNLPTWTSIFSATPTGYWYVWLANLILILVGFNVLTESLEYNE